MTTAIHGPSRRDDDDDAVAQRLRSRRVQYQTAGLDVGDVEPDPLVQWRRWYDDADSAGVAEPNAMTLATVDADGRPDARVVLARGIDARSLVFYTNLDSAKSAQLAATPHAAAVFAWLELHRQVRFRGAVEPVAAAESDAYFASRPRGSQIAAWASPQSHVVSGRAELESAVAATEERFTGRDVERPVAWGGWRLVVESAEFWQGRPNRLHDRLWYTPSDDGWTLARLAP